MPEVEKVVYPGGAPGTTIESYLCMPESVGPKPVIVVLRGVAGGDEGYTEIASRFASWGYVALVHKWYGTGNNPPDDLVESDLASALEFLRGIPQAQSARIAMAGYCKGAIYAFMAAAKFPAVKALLAFHGFAYRQLDAEHATQPFDLAEKISGPILIMHGTEDKSAPLETMREFDARLRALQKRSTLCVYEGAQHGFAVSTHPNFDAAVAGRSFEDAHAFLKKELA